MVWLMLAAAEREDSVERHSRRKWAHRAATRRMLYGARFNAACSKAGKLCDLANGGEEERTYGENSGRTDMDVAAVAAALDALSPVQREP